MSKILTGIRKNIWKILGGLTILAIAFFVYNGRRQADPTIFNPNRDQLIQAQRQTLYDSLTLAGSIDAASKADLHFQAGGQLAWVGVRVGDSVKKYQAIASLDRKSLQKNLEKSLNDYLTTRSTFEDTQDTSYKPAREKALFTDAIKRLLDRTQYGLNNAVLAVELNDLAIKYATITTPIAGIVTSVGQPNPGINVTYLDSIATVIDPNSLFLKCELDQEDVPKISLNQKATISLDSFPDQPIESEVSYIAFTPVAGQTSTVYETRFALAPNQQYRLGMDGDASIVLSQSDNALVLPSTAVNEENGQKYVSVFANGRITKKDVITGIETDEETEIISGISESDQVVVKKK